MEGIEAPPEVKEKIQQKMKESKKISEIEKRVLDALNTAAKEIVNNVPLEKSSLIHDPFKAESEYTVMTLSSVIKFLEEKGYNFALKSLIAESNYRIADKYHAPSINDILSNLIDNEEEEQIENNHEEEENEQEVEDDDNAIQNDEDDSQQDLSVDLSDEVSDEDEPAPKPKPEPKKEEVQQPKQPEKMPAVFQQNTQRKIPPAQNIKKADFDSNQYIVSVKDL